ncbi:ZP domain-containing protein, partial [Meloidogyne graminicola]
LLFNIPILFNYFSKLIFIFCLFEIFVGEKLNQNNELILENNLNIIELPVKLFPEINCNHQIRLNSENGSIIIKRKILIGETIAHVWNCDYNINNNFNNKANIYCMMVKNCTVSNQNKKSTTNNEVVEIIDEFGCSTWPDILPQIKYKGDLKAILILQAFALEYEKTAINFSCQITLLLKNNGRCRRPKSRIV